MEGRLVPPLDGQIQCFPRDRWRDEFPLAATIGLDTIEWIYDMSGILANPLCFETGVEEMKALARAHNVQVGSLCADYFMDKPLVRASPAEWEERLERLSWLVCRCGALGIGRIVLPFVDSSRIEMKADEDAAVAALNHVLPVAKEQKVEIHLETSLSPSGFADLLTRLPDPTFKVNYDSGNSAALGYDPREEFKAYGERVGSVHIKDRVLHGATVPIGAGSADFDALRKCLRSTSYDGDVILQVARGEPGKEAEWTARNRRLVLDWWGGTGAAMGSAR